jgi:four helix bundle protein
MRHLESLEAFRHGRELAVSVHRLTDLAPLKRYRSLTDQLQRASVSIPSNVAEAFALGTRPQLVRGLRIALGSAFELQTQLWIADRAGRLPETPLAAQTIAAADRETGLLVGLLKSYGATVNAK